MSTAHDLPLPPDLACDEPPLSDEVLDRLDAAFTRAYDDGLAPDAIAALVALDPLEDEDAPPAAALVPAEARGWSVEDDSAAEWAMRHCATIDTDLASLAAQRDDWQARIDHWFAQRSETVLRRRAFFQAHLMDYWARRREADPKGPKTLNLPSGRISSTDRTAAVRVIDDDTLAAWLTAHDLTVGPDGADLVLTSTKVYVVPLRKVLQPAGDGLVIMPTGEVLKPTEIPDGLGIEPGHTTYDVKPIIG